jgi:hypothetical protein
MPFPSTLREGRYPPEADVPSSTDRWAAFDALRRSVYLGLQDDRRCGAQSGSQLR